MRRKSAGSASDSHDNDCPLSIPGACYYAGMARVRLLHWKSAEAAAHIEALRSAGYEVEYEEQFRPALMKGWRESPPDAFVIDLSRLPSHGREIAIALRQSPRTRQVPIVFCDGTDEKIDRIRRDLPDAAYCSLSKLLSSLRKAIANPPLNPVKPVQMMDRYASRTAAQKLGIGASSTVALFDPPRDVLTILGALPSGVEFVEESDDGKASVTLCFVRDADSLRSVLSRVRRFASGSKLWILWRKGALAKVGGVTESLIRDQAIDLGLVDYKICSVNEVWSAMLFARKRSM
jgi:CheY-like chemotaxis protein